LRLGLRCGKGAAQGEGERDGAGERVLHRAGLVGWEPQNLPEAA
jgi:hypothetical protein